MAKTGPKTKSLAARRYNPYARQNPTPQTTFFDNIAGNYLRIARGETKANPNVSDTKSTASECHRQSWTREQKINAVKYESTA